MLLKSKNVIFTTRPIKFINVFYKKDNEISLESSPQLHKVETILNEYDESLEKATEDNFVDLDSILFVPSYQGDYKFQKHWLMKWVGLTVEEASKEILLDPFLLSNPPKEYIYIIIEQPDATRIENLTAGIAGIQFQDKEIWMRYNDECVPIKQSTYSLTNT
ncbi:unnamed protein product [Rhizophagus irregularis]|uniref:Uncharacterized protein n=1 Tax=Rhizophagus irregularis TaxID=588596 RepID=A0A915YUW5_9GLOM|nr:unnamed protein product [Rhizophagus irregularis]